MVVGTETLLGISSTDMVVCSFFRFRKRDPDAKEGREETSPVEVDVDVDPALP